MRARHGLMGTMIFGVALLASRLAAQQPTADPKPAGRTRRATEKMVGHRPHDPPRRPDDSLQGVGRHDAPQERHGRPDRTAVLGRLHAHRTSRTRARGRCRSSTTAARAPRRCGCTWARSARGARRRSTASSRRPRRTSSSTTRRRCSTRPTSSSSTRWAPATAASPARRRSKDFYGVDEDAAAFAQFIVTYISRNDRWNSPKFLIGESYGTFRSAALGNLLQQRYNVHLNGIDLISSVLDLSTITFGRRRRSRASSTTCRATRRWRGTTRR